MAEEFKMPAGHDIFIIQSGLLQKKIKSMVFCGFLEDFDGFSFGF
jgi:predicted nuclease with TOPRIM domain